MSGIIVVDDFVPVSLQNKYKEWLLGPGFPWFYSPDVTYSTALQQRPCVSHLLYDNGQKTTTLDVDILAHLGAERFNWPFNAIVAGKTILQFPLNSNVTGSKLDNLHTDLDPHYPHLVVLYYVVDADGDTLIYDVKNNGTPLNSLDPENHKLLTRVTPKQGRAVLFDGAYYHTAEQPKNGMRCIINLNVY